MSFLHSRSGIGRRCLPALAVGLLLAGAAACGGGDRITGPEPVASIVFPREADTLLVGGSKQLYATLRDGHGNVVTGATLHWTSSDSAVATVSSTGAATAVRAGVATIGASAGGRSASLRLVVQPVVTLVGPAEPSAVQPPPLPSSAGDGSFDIRVAWPDGRDGRAASLVDAAVARWKRVVTGDLSSLTFDMPADACYDGQPGSRETVDDLLIFVRVVKMDGPSGTLARAGPCLVRGGRGLSLVGIVELDSADVGRDAGLVQTVLTHELGHVLGLGTLWESRDLLHGKDTDNPVFLGATARDTYAELGGSSLVPIENTGSAGTKNGHWRESVFRSELMTGWIGSGLNPLSVVTIGALRDFGYAVSLGAADGYVLPAPNVASPSIVGTGIQLVDEVIEPRFTVDPSGRTERLPE